MEQVKKRAWEYLTQGWCKGRLAKDQFDNVVYPHSPSATQWCAMGAITVAHGDYAGQKFIDELYKIVGNVPKWNDRNTNSQENVVALVRSVEEAVLDG